MLQPRSCWIAAALLLAVLAKGDGEDLLNGSEDGKRWKRETGDVTVLSLEENGRLRDPPVGVLSSTARTFVNNGATTEFATQILGTTVGKTYAKLLSTGSRVFYDSSRQAKDPYLVFPTIPGISPTRSQVQYQTAEPFTPSSQESPTNLPSLNEIKEEPATTLQPKNVISVRKEFSVKKNTEVKPAKVKPNGNLPTVTIKNEFAPSGYSEQVDTIKEPKKSRLGKGLFRGGVQIKNEFQKFDTVTYVGFADFTTTVGNTVIIFMPKTAAANTGPVTSIAGAATLRPEDALHPVVTTVKTFMSHSPAMATKTVTGHNLNVQTSLPTVQADTRASKAYNPVFVTVEQYPTTEEIPTSEHTTAEGTSEFVTEQTTTEQDGHIFDSSEPDMPMEEVTPTEALKLGYTYTTTKTRVFIPGDEPLGLAKSIAVIQASDSTTTYLTSFLFGTIIEGSYTQLTQVVSSTATPKAITPTPVLSKPTITAAETTTEDADTTSTTENPPSTTEQNDDITTEQNEENKNDSDYITKLVPTTVHNTYTYFTTFFIPKGETTSTSVKTREVVSDEIRYVTTAVPQYENTTPPDLNISPTGVTESYQTTTPEEIGSTTEDTPSGSTPQLPTDITTNVNPVTQDYGNPDTTTLEPTTTEKEEEVDIIIRTLYTTYTYLTTFFQESTTSVRSREVVETNVVTSTLDTNNLPEATDPAVAGLFKSIKPTNVVENLSSDKSPEVPSPVEEYKTYTYYTTVFVDGETLIESRTEVVKETINPTSVSQVQYKTVLTDENNVVPKEYQNADGSDEALENKKKPAYGTISRPVFHGSPSSEALVDPKLQSSIDDTYSYDTTMSRNDRVTSTKPFVGKPGERDLLSAREELKKETISDFEDSEYVETIVTDVTSSSSGGNRRKSYEEYESNPNDQVSAESNTEEIEPSFSPTVLLQTSYTTFTYFTTVYKGTSSDVISRLETVTNLVTETVRPTEVETNLSPEEATLPITYFTTFTYWTTLYKGKSTMITSREETVSNIVTPTLSSSTSQSILLTETPLLLETPLSQSVEIIPTSDASQESVSPVSADLPTVFPDQTSEEITATPTSSEVILEPTTYYTTYTYFTTSYIGNDTVINSHLETETNVVTPTASDSQSLQTSEVESSSTVDAVEGESTTTPTPSLQPTGLISTIRSTVINEGLTTLLNTDVYGTYIDGLYAQVLESSSEVVTPTASSAAKLQPTGIVSLNEGKIVDAAGISTTLFTTKAIGTYIDDLYAQVVESTSTVVVDEEKKTANLEAPPSTTMIGSKVFTTGLVRLIEGSVIKDKDVTTFYESRVIGTIIDGRYAQIIESTSSFKSDLPQTTAVSPTSTVPPGSVISPTVTSTAPGPAAIESSLNNENEDKEADGGDDDEDGHFKSRLSFTSKKKQFTPVIRPFSSRPRPTFLPKKKTGDPATTITRTSFTPTVTATPASKTGFGSSRNRFAPSRKSSSAEFRPTTSSSRRYSRPRSSSTPTFGGGRSRSSTKVLPTISSTSARRGGFNYRSTGRPNLPNLSASSSRFRIRPTQANGRFSGSSTLAEDVNINDITGAAAVTEEIEQNTHPGDEEAVTAAPTTSTESPRRANNPLLRFRRPPILQRPSTTTTTTPKPSTTPKRSSLLRRPDSRAGSSYNAPKTRPVPSFTNNRVKQRPAGNLFPPRGLARKQPKEELEEKEENEEDQIDESGDDIQDNEYEGSETAEQTSSTTTEPPRSNRRRSKGFNQVQIRPFTRRPRTKRQASEYGSRGYTARYRRPSTRTTSPDYYYDEVVQEPVKPATRSYSSRSRGQSNYQQNQQKLRPSPTSSTPRHQFTLRERTSQTTANPRLNNFRRPTSSPRRRVSSELTTVSPRQKSSSRSRNPTTEATTFTRGSSRRYNSQRKTTRTNRYRDKNDFDPYVTPAFDGTITVTHKIPTEVTIPVFNGKSTEYKNVITAKPSLEVLGPYQYTSSFGKDGKSTIQLTSEITSTLPNGFMEVTKFLVYETPTTSVTFTPTTLRGRKTSFSHIVPSTIYEVRPEISTVQPDLGNAPLANLLLSQLLLGNLGMPNTVVQTPGTPTTEFKTKTTTYVTTVTSHTSTVLPLTFRGKAITTTIVDSSTQVITATEYLTETIVVTPTAVVAPQITNQLNTLLLPALLQAQLLGNQQKPKNNQQDFLNTKVQDDDDDDIEQRYSKDKDDDLEDERPVRESVEEPVQKSRKKGKIKAPDKPIPTSVVTLYVSGKHPGEFTTLLSTVVGGDESSSLRKREISPKDLKYYKIEASKLPQLGSSFSDDLSNYVTPVLDEVVIESSEIETQSLESVIGDVSKYLSSSYKDDRIQYSTTGHFLLKGLAESAPDQRKASSRSDAPLRRKRQIEQDQPKRKLIRIKVPIVRAKPVREEDEDDYDSTTEQATRQSPTEYFFEEPTTERNVKRVRVAKKRISEMVGGETPKRRIVVTRRRPIDPIEVEPTEYIKETEESPRPLHETIQPKRRRILKTKKRLVTQDSGFTEPTQRRRITITKKRPLQTEDIQSSPVLDMSTLYNYQYSIPSEEGKASVMVSQVFMSGPDSVYLAPNMEDKIKEILNEPSFELESGKTENERESASSHAGQPKIVRPVKPTVIRGDTLYRETTKYVESETEHAPTTPFEEQYVQSTPQDSEQRPTTEPNVFEENVTTQPDSANGTEDRQPESDVDTKERKTESDDKEEQQPESYDATEEEPEEEEEPDTYEEYEDFEPTQTPESKDEYEEEQEAVTENQEEKFELDPTFVTIFPYDDVTEDVTQTVVPTTEYETVTKTLTTTRLRTYTYVVTRVSGSEQIITSSTSVKPDVKTVTVTETVPVTPTATANTEIGRGLYVVEPRYNLATKVMSNGVEVIVAGGKSTLPGSPQLRVIPSGLAKPITLAPSTLTDHMMMLLPQESQKPHNDFITKTYMTTYTYLTTFAQEGSTVVSSREKVVSNVVTEEVNPSKTRPVDHFTLTSSPELMTGVYHTTYTYLNTLVDGELPLVVTSKKTVSNTVTEQSNFIQPSELPVQDTNTYLSTVAYTKTLSEGDEMKVVSTEDVLTQVVITESDYLPSSLSEEIRPTAITTDVTKTYFATYTYFKTKVEDGKTIVNTEVATSSDIVTETFTIQPKKTSTEVAQTPETKVHETGDQSDSQPINLFATKTYLTTFTYFTTLLQDNKSPSIVVKSRTKVQQNIVTETVDSGLLDTGYLDLLKSSVNDNHDSIIATATLNNGDQMEITAMTSDLIRETESPSVATSFTEVTPSNVITGSTIIFFDEEDQMDSTPSFVQPSFTDSHKDHNLQSKTATPTLSKTAKPSPTSASQTYNTKVTDYDKDQVSIPDIVNGPITSGSSGSVNIFNGFNALGPVINAMADLFHSNFNGKQPNVSAPRPVVHFAPHNPFETQQKEIGTTPRSPVYIPVGGVFDSEPSESQHYDGHNIYPEVNQRTKPLRDRPNIEAALLSGGIPISPGQVITTNSDVIIGKHAVHGPRPPVKPFGKDNVEGMKPPPPPPPPQSSPPKPNWPPRDQERYPSSHVPHRVPSNPEIPRFPPKRDHHIGGGTILAPPPPVRDHYIPLRDRVPPKLNVPHKNYPEIKVDVPTDPDFPYPIDSQNEQSQTLVNLYPGNNKHPKLPQIVSNLPGLKSQGEQNVNYNNKLKQPQTDHQYLKYRPVFKVPKPSFEKHENKDEPSHFINVSVSQQVYKDEKLEENQFNHPLLVNIQPSQVANVVIPHGVSTALVYNGEPEKHNQKGEIFNEPSPYPDVEVGMVGVAGLSTSSENKPPHAAHIPSNAIRMDVPLSPQGIESEVFKVPTNDNNKRRPVTGKRPAANFILEHATGLEYMTPPPPPISALVNYHLGHDIEDQDSESSVNSEYHTDGSGERINQPLKSKPFFDYDGEPAPPKPAIRPDINTSGANGVKYSAINSRPVVLGFENTEKPPPIIKGIPNVNTFGEDSQATVAVGKPTNMTPKDDMDHILIVSDKVDVVGTSHSPFDLNRDQTAPQNQPQHPSAKPPFDNTVYAMNMDEKLPLPTYETPPQLTTYEIPPSSKEEDNTARPINMEIDRDRNSAYQSDAVLGLTPPAATRYPNHDKTTHRPSQSSRRPFPPFRKRPNPPPYKFERPLPTIESRPKKPTFLETERPPLPPVPTEILSPPKPTDDFVRNGNKNRQTTDRNDTKPSATSHESINPILEGSLVVEPPAKPEVIAPESKVVLNNNFKPGGHLNKNKPKYPDSSPLSTKFYTPTLASQDNTRPSTQKPFLVGSETVFPEESLPTSTESLKPTLVVESASPVSPTTFDSSPATQFVIPARATKLHNSIIPFFIRDRPADKHPLGSSPAGNVGNKPTTKTFTVQNIIVSPVATTHVVTHTQTLTVTTTESKIIQSKGQKPSTHTLVVTKTLTSTLLDTVTEIHTLVKPTSILSTVTTTMPQVTTTVFPTITPPHPESTKIVQESDSVTAGTNDNDSILVIMTDKDSQYAPAKYDPDEPPLEIEAPEEEEEVNPNVLLGGFLSHHSSDNECKPDCKATKNERCQKINNIMRCVCRPGFARMFPDRPCKPTYTFRLSIPLERLGPEKITYSPTLLDTNSTDYQALSEATKEGLDRMIMQSEIRDVYHSLQITGFKPDNKEDNAMANFYIQLSENTDEMKLMEMFKKHLMSNNFSIGGTDLHASKEKIEHLRAEDFDECNDTKFHDCSENAQCFNLRGTYTCSCKEGFTDLSHNTLYPGRVCSAEMIGCQRCNFHGNCFTRNEEEELCECFQWYAGQYCQINLKVMLLILSLVGISLMVLLVVCLVLSCMRRRPVRKAAAALRPQGFRFRPPRPSPADKRAMINMDTSSEASMEHTPPPYIKQRPRPCRKQSKAPSPPLSFHGTMEQRDRSLTVMIPRAKYRPVPVQPMSTFGPEQKLLKYLTIEKPGSRSNSRKPSSSTNHSHDPPSPKKTQIPSPSRKPSAGALVSAGFEVSATVGRTKEIHECYITEPHTDLGQTGFSTIRTADSSIIVDIPPPPTLEAELLDTSKIDLLTVSEARSYDETTIHPPTKCLQGHYDKHMSDEGHTMVERDIGSTFVMPQSHLYKPDRGNGSDISNFDSL
ncbi:mucin-17 isoform X2 [Cimex lectularius]|uniref:Uncharacterized protein n=1 Tax=Cimex lectularius TaxID=79782 RepID=A0A8I6SJC8_CIMLE|nr:mucin-17 isoform X2 [Cimex lectularius]